MKTLEKVLDTLAKNVGYTVVLAVSAVLFFVFSDGLLSGLITAGSALIGYACIEMLYKEYKNMPDSKKSVKKKK